MAVSPFPAAAHSTAGRPNYQQDRHIIHHAHSATLYAVADGHGSPDTGHAVSEHIAATLPSLLHSCDVFARRADTARLLRAAVAKLDESAIAHTSKQRVYAGSTLCAVLRVDDRLFCANVGDSRAIVVTAAGAARPLSTDHLCTHPRERRRIEDAGGVVVGGLLNGYISMSRAIGDDDLKGHRNLTPFPVNAGRRFGERLFVADADVQVADVGERDMVTVVASDGVWGKLSNEDVAAVVRAELARGSNAREVAQAIVKRAIAKGSKDNVTAIVGFLWEDSVVWQRVEKRLRRRKGHVTPIGVMEGARTLGLEEDSDTQTSSDGVSGDVVMRTNRSDDEKKRSLRRSLRTLKISSRIKSSLQ